MAKAERLSNIIPVDLSMLNAIVKACDKSLQVEEFSLFEGGKCTSNYRLKMKDCSKDWVLKIYPEENKGCKRESAVYSELQGVLPIPELICSNTQRQIINNDYIIMECLKGITLNYYVKENKAFPKELAYEIGQALGTLHQCEYQSDLGLSEYCSSENKLESILERYNCYLEGRAGQRLGVELKGKISSYIKNNKGIFEEISNKLCFSHGDFRPANLIINENRLHGIIDWELALIAPKYFDIGQFVRVEKYVIDKAEEYFVLGYNSIAKEPLEHDWKKKARLVDLENILRFLNEEQEKPIMNQKLLVLVESVVRYLYE